MTLRSDLDVDRLSDCLKGIACDLVVTGSIGAVESVRFTRALRRLGAEVHVFLTSGAAQFVTPMALEWASTRPTTTDFRGDATHLATRDLCIVAPMTADFMAKLAHGLADDPAAALCQSYLGQGKPVIVLPNMHDSLAESPAAKSNLQTLAGTVRIVMPRLEEGKQKFPEPDVAADECAHAFYKARGKDKPRKCLVTLGGTKAYLDQVRSIGNESTGRLGTAIVHELYRYGFEVTALCGTGQTLPKVGQRLMTPTYEGMEQGLASLGYGEGFDAAIMAAAVLDFVPMSRFDGKIVSSDPTLNLTLQATPKLIGKLSAKIPQTIGFKLESGLTEERVKQVAQDYCKRYGLKRLIINDATEIDIDHRAFLAGPDGSYHVAVGKQEIAIELTRYLKAALM